MRVLAVLIAAGLVLAGLWWLGRTGRLPDPLSLPDVAGIIARDPGWHREPQECFRRLGETGMQVRRIGDFATGSGCSVRDAVRVERSGVGFTGPFIATCRFAVAFADFERTVLQPAALRLFGRRVVRIEHLGSYNCRPIRDAASSRLSQHAFADALDVSAFMLADGSRIAVLADWARDGPRRAFLREVARGACGPFKAVLTPAWDRRHADHLHLDMGSRRICGIF